MKESDPVIRPLKNTREKEICAEIMARSDPWIRLGISREQLLQTISDPWNDAFVVVLNEEVAGAFILQMHGAVPVYLKSIVVKPELRGRSLGRKMMSFIEGKVFATHSNLFLCVSSFNKGARKFYENLGYEQVGTLKDYIIRGEDEILMRKSIGPILP